MVFEDMIPVYAMKRWLFWIYYIDVRTPLHDILPWGRANVCNCSLSTTVSQP